MNEENLLENQLPQEPELDPNKKYYEEYVGEGKKFSDNEALAKGKAYSDSYIKILERRMDEMRADYLKMREENMAKAKLEELLDQYQKKLTSSNENTPSERSHEEKPELDLTKIESLVSEKIQQSKVADREKENFNKVKTKLKEQYGTRYQDVLNKQIDELGLTVDEVNAWAKKSPEAFFRMMKMDEPMKANTTNLLPNSNVRSDSFRPTEKKRTWTYYQELKKTNPKLYYDRETNVQMNKDAVELGESFMDGDYFTTFHQKNF